MNDHARDSGERADARHWLAELARHHEQLRRSHPHDRLLLLLEVDEILGESTDAESTGVGERMRLRSRSARVLEVVRWLQLQPLTSVG